MSLTLMCGMIVTRVRSVWDESGACSSQIQFLEEVVALVVDHDEGRKILHLDPPARLHAEFRIPHGLDLLDAMLGEVRGGAADRGEIEAAIFVAGLAHRRRAVALGQHHHGAAGGLESPTNESIRPAVVGPNAPEA